MEIILLFAAGIIVVLPVAWWASEFQERRWLRIWLGTAALFSCFGAAFLFTQINRYNYNAWYGSATLDLIEAMHFTLEQDRSELVQQELKRLQAEFHPTYENKAHYDELASQAAKRINAVFGRENLSSRE